MGGGRGSPLGLAVHAAQAAVHEGGQARGGHHEHVHQPATRGRTHTSITAWRNAGRRRPSFGRPGRSVLPSCRTRATLESRSNQEAHTRDALLSKKTEMSGPDKQLSMASSDARDVEDADLCCRRATPRAYATRSCAERLAAGATHVPSSSKRWSTEWALKVRTKSAYSEMSRFSRRPPLHKDGQPQQASARGGEAEKDTTVPGGRGRTRRWTLQ